MSTATIDSWPRADRHVSPEDRPATGSNNGVAALIRRYFAAYLAKDRAAAAELLSEDFTFTSPLDDHISRERYFTRCWPNSAHQRAFHFEEILADEHGGFVTYTCERTDGLTFRNTEYFTVEEGRITAVEVYFGSEQIESAVEAEIHALIDRTVKAVRAKDADALIADYAPDVVAFDLIEPLQSIGSEAVAKRARQWFRSFEGTIDYSVRNLKIVADGGVAFCRSLNQVSGVQAGQRMEMSWRATVCCEKRGGRWLVTHLHSSVPFEMETGQASMGLKG